MKFVVPVNGNGDEKYEINEFYKEKFTLFDDGKSIDTLKLTDKGLVVILNSNKVITMSKSYIINNCSKRNKSNCDNHLNPYCIWIEVLNSCKVYDLYDANLQRLIADNKKNNSSQNNNDTKIYTNVIFEQQQVLTTSRSSYSNSHEQNVYFIAFVFIISILISFTFGMVVMFKLIGQKINMKKIFMLNNNQKSRVGAQIRAFQMTILNVLRNFKMICYEFCSRIRNKRLFPTTDVVVVVDKQSDCCSESSSDCQIDPRYVYVLNIVDTIKLEEKKLSDKTWNGIDNLYTS